MTTRGEQLVRSALHAGLRAQAKRRVRLAGKHVDYIACAALVRSERCPVDGGALECDGPCVVEVLK